MDNMCGIPVFLPGIITNAIMGKIVESTLEINLSALAHNYHYLRSKTTPTTRFMGVVKAYAYGSESVVIAQKLAELGADYLAVAYLKEGVQLRNAGITLPILIFHPLPAQFKKVIQHQLTPTLYSRLTLTQFIETAQKLGQQNYPVHLILNTGLNRLGFDSVDIDFINQAIAKTDAIKIDGIYSHLSASEDLNEQAFTLSQYESFKNLSEQITQNLSYKPLRHLCNTSGIINYPQAHFDMVRSGIGLHGYGNTPKEDVQLQPVSTLKTIISQLRHIKKGDSVSYNRQFIADKPMTIATLSLGYADGLQRNYSNGKTMVSINGKLAPIVGYICMDMIMVDVTNVSCQEGDEVVVFGFQKSASALAEMAGTISYEVITTISQRVKRIVIP